MSGETRVLAEALHEEAVTGDPHCGQFPFETCPDRLGHGEVAEDLELAVERAGYTLISKDSLAALERGAQNWAEYLGDLGAEVDPAIRAALEGKPALERVRVEQDARFQDALDALMLATLWVNRTADFPTAEDQRAESWRRKARSGITAIRAALEGKP